MYNFNNDFGNMIWINSKEELRNVCVMPNKQKVFFLRSAENPIFYVVSANELGMTTIRTFSFEEYTETKQEEKYVTKEEFQKLVDMLGGIKNESTIPTTDK